jgi:hypothetical protein
MGRSMPMEARPSLNPVIPHPPRRHAAHRQHCQASQLTSGPSATGDICLGGGGEGDRCRGLCWKGSASNGTVERSIMSARREAGSDAVNELSEVRREDSRERSEDSRGLDVKLEECRPGKGVSEDEPLLELVGRELCPRAGCDGDLCQVCVVNRSWEPRQPNLS